MVQHLTNILLTKGFSEQELALLAEIAQTEQYYKDEIIFNTDDPADRLYILAEGKVLIERQLAPPSLPVSKQLLKVKKGQLFGEMGLLEETTRTASARAASRVKAIGFSYDDLKQLFQQQPELGYRFMYNISAILAVRLRQIHKQLLMTNTKQGHILELEYYFG